MRIDVITIFPEYLSPLQLSLVGKAQQSGSIQVQLHDLREHAHDRHRTVDDSPFGGGPGMVMKPDVWGAAIDAVLANPPHPQVRATLVVPAPVGYQFTHDAAESLAAQEWLIFLPARYEGMDARVVAHYRTRAEVSAVHEYCIGDYVLAGGEAAVLVMVEALSRFVPGVLGNDESVTDDSFAPGADGLLAAPVYTRPAQWRDLDVPEILLSGDHARIAEWRREQGREATRTYRPDLLSD
jgi:tRNA (guanine37-N1)-methyltransferase